MVLVSVPHHVDQLVRFYAQVEHITRPDVCAAQHNTDAASTFDPAPMHTDNDSQYTWSALLLLGCTVAVRLAHISSSRQYAWATARTSPAPPWKPTLTGLNSSAITLSASADVNRPNCNMQEDTTQDGHSVQPEDAYAFQHVLVLASNFQNCTHRHA